MTKETLPPAEQQETKWNPLKYLKRNKDERAQRNQRETEQGKAILTQLKNNLVYRKTPEEMEQFKQELKAMDPKRRRIKLESTIPLELSEITDKDEQARIRRQWKAISWTNRAKISKEFAIELGQEWTA